LSRKNPPCYFRLWRCFLVFYFKIDFFLEYGLERFFKWLLWNNVKVNERGRESRLFLLVDFNLGGLFWSLSFFWQCCSLAFVLKRTQWFLFVNKFFKPFPLVEFSCGEFFWLLSYFLTLVLFSIFFLKSLMAFICQRGSYLNLCPLLNLAVGSCLDRFPLSKINVIWHIVLESSMVFLCQKVVV